MHVSRSIDGGPTLRIGAQEGLDLLHRDVPASILAVGSAFEAEQLASRAVGTFWRGRSKSAATFGGVLVRRIAADGDEAALAALLALDAVWRGGPAGEAARAVQRQGVRPPRWAADLGGAAALSACCFRRPEEGTRSEVLEIRFSHVDGPRHAVVAFVDHDRGGFAKILGLIGDTAIGQTDLGEREELAPSEAAARIRSALRRSEGRFRREVYDDLWYLRALVLSRLDAAEGSA